MRSKMGPLSYKSAVASYEYNHYEGDLPIMLGTDRRGEVIMGDLARMGNLLLWGVGVELDDFLEGLLVNLTSRFSLDEVGIVMMDFAEWCTRFANIPHLVEPLITDYRQLPDVMPQLKELVRQRIVKFREASVTNFKEYNLKAKMLSREGAGPDGTGVEPMKRILVFMNDPAFLMGITKTEKLFDEFLNYYASFPVRAVGVHLILASQPTDLLRWKLFMPGLMRNRLEFLGADRVPLGEGYDLQAREWLEEYDNMIYHGYDTDEQGMFLQRIVN